MATRLLGANMAWVIVTGGARASSPGSSPYQRRRSAGHLQGGGGMPLAFTFERATAA
jgi:hypothetical protein